MIKYFRKYDSDDDGLLTASEFVKLLRKMDSFLTLQEVEDLIMRFDLNEDQSLSESEYLQLMETIQREVKNRMDKKLQAQFDKFDTDGDGFVTAEEMYKVLVKTYPSMSIEAAQILLRDADLDKDGKVSIEEFRKMDIY